MQLPYGFTDIDACALGVFFLTWISHYHIVNRSRWRVKTITYSMTLMREKWMRNVVARGDSPVDAIIQNGLQQGVLFFASTTVLLIGGLVAGLGSAERGVAVLSEIPLSTTNNTGQWEFKLLMIIFIFMMAFFKFAWSHRLYNYILIMIGARPDPESAKDVLDLYARKLALLHALAAKHFTTGLNAYFFALATFAWFINAWTFMAATIWVALVMYRRAFRSEFKRLVNASEL